MQAQETHDSHVQKKIHFLNDVAKSLLRLSPLELLYLLRLTSDSFIQYHHSRKEQGRL